jgi:hypothetical protein
MDFITIIVWTETVGVGFAITTTIYRTEEGFY